MKLSIVATLYKSAPYVNEFYARSSAVAKQLAGDDFEIILVNDGSPDDSLDIARSLSDYDPHVVVVDLSRNFGHHKAMMTGLAHTKGELTFLIDSDLEEEPEWLMNFEIQLKKQKCDVVYGVQKRRKGNWYERWSGKIFYSFFKAFTGLPLPENLVTARLMTRRYVDALLLHREREILIAGLWYLTGFEQHPYLVSKHSTSETTYTLGKKLSIVVKSVTSFSSLPLVIIFYVGCCVSLMAAGYMIYIVASWFVFARPLVGWASIIASIWLLGGTTILFLGVIGIYLSKIFSETKQRPYTIVRQVYGRKKL
ncbi:glycosyltransferase family 2 protein [Synechococcus sp. FGCU-3]|nr:glycosyltransferase family 2 protein [Synechococcus sp. FGCU3]